MAVCCSLDAMDKYGKMNGSEERNDDLLKTGGLDLEKKRRRVKLGPLAVGVIAEQRVDLRIFCNFSATRGNGHYATCLTPSIGHISLHECEATVGVLSSPTGTPPTSS